MSPAKVVRVLVWMIVVQVIAVIGHAALYVAIGWENGDTMSGRLQDITEILAWASLIGIPATGLLVLSIIGEL